MKIIIVGDGKVGYTLSENLSREGHDITIIDNQRHVLKKSIEALDVIAITGNGASYAVQHEAGVSSADLLIAATSMDEVNMLCCLIAKKLGAKNTIARIRNPEYNEQLQLMKEEMGLSMVVNPELASATEIFRLISFPSAISIGTFSKSKVFLIEYKVEAGNPLAGKAIGELQGKHSSKILICAVARGQDTYIPNGDFVIQAGDNIHLAGTHRHISEFLLSLGQRDKRIKSAFIVGGGLIAFYLSKLLIDHGIQVKIIDKKEIKCGQLCESIPEALIIYGDGTDKELLDAEGLAYTDVFIGLTDIDEENLIMSLYAAYKNVPKVITKINRLEYAEVIKKAGVDRVISPKHIAANEIVRYVRSMERPGFGDIKTLYRIIGRQVEMVEFLATANTRHLGTPLSVLPLKSDLLITAIVRGRHVIIPKGKDYLQENDTVIVVTAKRQLDNLNQIFSD